MKINLNNRSSFWNIKSNKNYTNDILCILNDEFKIKINFSRCKLIHII